MDTSLDTDTLDTGICCYSRCYIVALQHLLLSTGPSTSAVNQLKTALFAVNLSVKHRLLSMMANGAFRVSHAVSLRPLNAVVNAVFALTCPLTKFC